MASVRDSGFQTWRIIVVVGLSLLFVLFDGANFRRFWSPVGIFGYGTDLNGVVSGVTPDLPASKAGLQVGDRIDTSAMTPEQLEELLQFPAVPSVGLVRTVGFYRDDVRRTVTMASVSEPMGPVNEAVIIFQFIAVVVCLSIGAAVVLLKPEPATWGFFLFSLGFAPVDQTAEFILIGASTTVQVVQMTLGVVGALGTVGLLVFAFRFLTPTLPRWRRIVQWAFPLIFIAAASIYCFEVYDTYIVFHPAAWLGHAGLAVGIVSDALVVVALVDTYVHRSGADRQRIRWVVLGFAVALLASLANLFVQTEVTNAPFVLPSVLEIASSVAPLAVAYAVIKHRVIDVNFVVSRTLVYGVLTAFFIALFALIDWFVGHVLDQSRWALIVEIAAAIAIGFGLNGLHGWIDRLVDSVLFRKRHAAERRLASLARGLPHADSVALVDASLIGEPRDALELASAALFRRSADGRYRCASAVEWPDSANAALASEDPLILYLQAERAAIRLADIHASRDGWAGAARPAIALPIFVRHDLDAIAMFGPHRGGEEFDSDEVRWLNALASAAGAAYDHLEADELRRENERIRRENEAQRAAMLRMGLPAAD